jgi:hypothetical protein
MSTNALTPPEPLNLIAFEHVRAIIEDTDRDLTELERLAAEATAEADEAEARAADAGIDGPASHWTLVQMQRFVDGLRAEAQLERTAILEVARYRARLRVEDASPDVQRMRFQPVAQPAVAHGEDVDVREVAGPTPIAEEPAQSSISVAVDDTYGQAGFESFVPNGALAGELNGNDPGPNENQTRGAESESTSVFIAPPETEPPTSGPESPAATPVEAVKEPVFFQHADDEAAVGGFVSEPLVPDPLTHDETSEQQDFWPTENVVPRRRGLRRIPFSAVLEVLVVLLILVFILLRLS